MSKRDKVGDDQNEILAGIKSQSSPMVRRSGQPVILIHRSAPPPVASVDATVSDEDSFESVGTVAIRLFAQWKLPRMQMSPVRGAGEETTPNRLPSLYREEED